MKCIQHHLWRFLWLVCLGVAAPLAVLAQTRDENLYEQKGMAAVQRQDWNVALENLLIAQETDPQSPTIVFNLALVSEQLPGHELRAIAWFKLYLLKRPDAPDAAAVGQQIAALERGYEAKISSIADKLETILMLRKARYQGGRTSVPDALSHIAAATGWDIASIHYAVGDIKTATHSIKTMNGVGWRKEWEDTWENAEYQSDLSGEESIVTAIAAAGLLSEAFDMLHSNYYPRTVDFFLEQGDVGRLGRLRSAASANEGAANNHRDECSQTDFAIGVMSQCRMVGWWGPKREDFLLKIARNGVEINDQHDETDIADYLSKENLDETNIKYAFQVYPSSAAFEIARLALEYRRLRGPRR